MLDSEYYNQPFAESEFQPQFQGDERAQVVAGLEQVLCDVIEQSKPQLISLEGPTGFGKTRIITEFYKKLAHSQSSKYWPDELLSGSIADSKEVSTSRKVIYPRPSLLSKRPEDSLPEYMWWGINCQSNDGGPVETIYSALTQLDNHKNYLEAAWNNHQTRFNRIKSKINISASLNNSTEEATNVGLGELIEEATGAVMPCVGLFSKLSRWVIKDSLNSKKIHQKISASGVFLDESRQEQLLDELYSAIVKLAIPALPMIIVIEDLHNAHQLTTDLLQLLMRSDASILVLTTSINDSESGNDALKILLSDSTINSRTSRVVSDRSINDRRFGNSLKFEKLSESSLSQIIKFYYSETDSSTCKLLTSKYTNPLFLEMICNTRKHIKKFKEERKLVLNEKDLEILPSDLEGIYTNLWNELNDFEKDYLTLCTLVVPEGEINWHNGIVDNVYWDFFSANKINPISFSRSWVSSLEESTSIMKFNEYICFDITKRSLNERFDEEEIKIFVSEVCKKLEVTCILEGTPENILVSRLIIHFHRQNLVCDRSAFDAIETLYNEFRYRPEEVKYRCELGSILVKLELEEHSVEYVNLLTEYCEDLRYLERWSELISTLNVALSILQNLSDVTEFVYTIRCNLILAKYSNYSLDYDLENKIKDLNELKREAASELGEHNQTVLDLCGTYLSAKCDLEVIDETIAEIDSFTSKHEKRLNTQVLLNLKLLSSLYKYQNENLAKPDYIKNLTSLYELAVNEIEQGVNVGEILVHIGSILAGAIAEMGDVKNALQVYNQVESICDQEAGPNSLLSSKIKLFRARLNAENGSGINAISEDLTAAKNFVINQSFNRRTENAQDINASIVSEVIRLYVKFGRSDLISSFVEELKSTGLDFDVALIKSYIFTGIKSQIIYAFENLLRDETKDLQAFEIEKLNQLDDIIDIVESILNFFKELELYGEALEIVEYACQMNVDFPQLEPSDLCRLNYYKAVILIELKRHKESLSSLSNLITEVSGIDCPELLDNVKLAMVDAYIAGGDLKQAKSLLKELVKEAQKRFPKDSLDIRTDTEDHNEKHLLKIYVRQKEIDSLSTLRAKKQVGSKPKRKKRVKAKKKKK